MNHPNFNRWLLLLSLACAVFFLPVIFPHQSGSGEVFAAAATTAPTSSQHYLWENGITIERRPVPNHNYAAAIVNLPQISGLLDQVRARALNDELARLFQSYASGRSLLGRPAVRYNQFRVNYEVTANHNNILCLSVHRFTETIPLVDDPEPQAVLIYELQTGRRLQLADLFTAQTDYRHQINTEISRQIMARQADEDYTHRPFSGIEPQPLFYLRPNALVIILTDQDQYFSPDDYYYQDRLGFVIPLWRLSGVQIYNRFWRPGQKIYSKTKLPQYLLSNPLTLGQQVKRKVEGEDYRELPYWIITASLNQTVATKINQRLEAEAEQLFTKKKFNYASLDPDGNFGGYLSMVINEYNQQGASTSRGICFDLKTGQIARLGALFKSWANAKETIGRAIVKAYGAKDYHGFDAIEAQTSFSFSKTELVLYFAPSLTLVKGRANLSLIIPYEQFGGKEQMKIFD